ncbi:WhiB family transcriptional regulator, partial [Streptomyces clavuligerus]
MRRPQERPRTAGPDTAAGRDAMAWQRAAACADEDPELFFPVSGSGPGAEQVARARKVCERCPVVQDCLDWAKRTGQRTGVWGGVFAP